MRRSVVSAAVAIFAWGLMQPVALAPAAASIITHAPRWPLGRGTVNWASSNWSGYALSGTGFHAITGSWIVPTAAPTTKSTYSSSWIGIDGFNNSFLIQTGTEQDYYGGSAHYLAWWEILPAAETVISSITVHPGDHFSASVTKGSGTSWTMTITDVTTGKSFSITKTYLGPGTSAEWIQEAPSSCNPTCHVLKLAHYGQTTFDPGTVNGGNPHLVTADSGVMIQGTRQVSTPSVPDSDTDGFNIKYGATQPPPPSS